ncbi:MAG: hypothetical protein ACOC2F_07605 [Bacteroidota bacterium]
MNCLEPGIPEPFGFNAIKHHLLFCRGYVKQFSASKDNWADKIKSDFLCIGNNVIDIYSGRLLLPELVAELTQIMISKGFYSYHELKEVLSKRGYLVFPLSDGSRWVIRFGKEDKRYIHVHPARKGKWLFRTKGNSWKTALAYIILSKENQTHLDRIALINQVRTELLALSPVRSAADSTEIFNCIVKLQN